MVQVGKLWGDAKFNSLSPISKLLYCYLVSQPSISTLGVIDIYLDKIEFDLSLVRHSSPHTLGELSKVGYIIRVLNKDEPQRTKIIVLEHFKSLPKSKSNLRKAIDEGKNSDESLKEILRDIFSSKDFNDDSFTPPTPSEVSKYALSIGYIVKGKDFVEYYTDNDWYDKNDKKVRNWKAKVRKVWCRDTNKLETADGAPKGFKYFYVEIEEGHRVYPQSWVRGLPSHKNHIYTQYLIDEFNKTRL